MNKHSGFQPFVHHLSILLFNLIEKLHHNKNDNELEIIKNTGLFNFTNDEEFQPILNSLRLVKYSKNI